MALLHAKPFNLLPPFSSSSSSSCPPPSLTLTTSRTPKPQSLALTPLPMRRRMPVPGVVEENQQSTEPEPESELASELKKAMQERKDKEGGDNFWNGVAQEINEIEWPAFGKVLGTTGVVLSVIFGSSVVLLTVNAVLAELSDKAFAGKGIQDFFT